MTIALLILILLVGLVWVVTVAVAVAGPGSLQKTIMEKMRADHAHYETVWAKEPPRLISEQC